MAKKKKIGLYDIGRVPVTEVANKSGYESNKELSARLLREEAEELAKKQQAIEEADPINIAKKALINTETQVALQNRTRLTKLYRDVDTLEDYVKNDIEALTDNIGLPTTSDVSMTDAGGRAKAFIDSLPVGTFQSDEARSKFRSYVYVAAYNHTVIDGSSLRTMLERAEMLGIGITLPRATQAREKVTPTPTFDDISGLNAENREQRRQIMNILGDNFTTEVADTFNRWQAQLMRDYGYAMPNAIIKRALQYVTDANLSPLAETTWDRVRVLFVKNGWFPAGMLTEREKLSAFCDTHDLNDREVRSYIARKNREIQESEPALQPHK
jgi:hypothetical protein